MRCSLYATVNNLNLRTEKHKQGGDDDDAVKYQAVDVKLVAEHIPFDEISAFVALGQETLDDLQAKGVGSLNVATEWENHVVRFDGENNLPAIELHGCKINKVSANISGQQPGYCELWLRVQAYPNHDTDLGHLARLHTELASVSMEPEKDLAEQMGAND